MKNCPYCDFPLIEDVPINGKPTKVQTMHDIIKRDELELSERYGDNKVAKSLLVGKDSEEGSQIVSKEYESSTRIYCSNDECDYDYWVDYTNFSSSVARGFTSSLTLGGAADSSVEY